MIPWPKAIRAPPFPLSLPFAMVTAVTGPGIITPESDMMATEARKIRTFSSGSI